MSTLIETDDGWVGSTVPTDECPYCTPSAATPDERRVVGIDRLCQLHLSRVRLVEVRNYRVEHRAED